MKTQEVIDAENVWVDDRKRLNYTLNSQRWLKRTRYKAETYKTSKNGSNSKRDI